MGIGIEIITRVSLKDGKSCLELSKYGVENVVKMFTQSFIPRNLTYTY